MASVAEIDCTARTMKRTTAMILHGETYGTDQSTRLVGRNALDEPAATYADDTIFGLAIKLACAGTAVDDKANPAFDTLSQARAYGLYMSTR